MNIHERATWNRLLALDFDATGAALPFSLRLARDNGWTHSLALRALDEYRKFCFLAVHAGHAVTPSDTVDQVWHQHLTYSRHYWESLCRDALGRPLHHGPTEGGAAEDRKFHDWYGRTLASYRRYFGEPPAGIWPNAEERFDDHHDFVRIDRRDLVTVDRVLLKRGAWAALAAAGFLAVAEAIAQTGEAARASSILLPIVGLLFLAGVIGLVVAAVRGGGRARHRDRRRDRRAAAAASGGAFAGCGSSAKHGLGDGNGHDGSASTDGGGGGCGSSGCGGGGGGGCGGGGS